MMSSFEFVAGSKRFDLTHRSIIMGILNVTPDSFSDGGKYVSVDAALKHAASMIEEGADIIDVGGESTRPGAKRVSEEEELRRVVPVVSAIAKEFPDVLISIDTVKSGVAKACANEGAHIVNDVSGGRFDENMFSLVASLGLSMIIMHSSAEPDVMQQHTDYSNVVEDVASFLSAQVEQALSSGIDASCIALDPGIGFGKTVEQNFSLIKHIDRFVSLGYPVLLGVSRKSFIGKTLDLPIDERLEGTLAMQAAGYLFGARIFRVHDVKPARRVADMMEALNKAP